MFFAVTFSKNPSASALPVKTIRRSMQSPQKPVLAQKGRKPMRDKPLQEAPSPSRRGKRPKNATLARNVQNTDNLKKRRGLKPGRKVYCTFFSQFSLIFLFCFGTHYMQNLVFGFCGLEIINSLWKEVNCSCSTVHHWKSHFTYSLRVKVDVFHRCVAGICFITRVLTL